MTAANSSAKLTRPVRAFLVALRDGTATNPTQPTIRAALAAGLVEYREGERVEESGRWRTVGDGYFLTAAGRSAL